MWVSLIIRHILPLSHDLAYVPQYSAREEHRTCLHTHTHTNKTQFKSEILSLALDFSPVEKLSGHFSPVQLTETMLSCRENLFTCKR